MKRITENLKSLFHIFLFSGFMLSSGMLYYRLQSAQDVADKTGGLIILLYLNLGYLLLLIFFTGRYLLLVWRQIRTKLHMYFAKVFALMTIAPAMLVGLFVTVFFKVGGLDAWFGKPLRTSVENATEVAQAYIDEYKKNIQVVAMRLAEFLRAQMPEIWKNKEMLKGILDDIAGNNLTEALIFNGRKEVVARSYLTFALTIAKIQPEEMARVKRGEIVIQQLSDRIRALVLLDQQTDTYLFIGKAVDRKILKHIRNTQKAVNTYRMLAQQHGDLPLIFAVYFILVLILLVFGAIAAGFRVAASLFVPMRQITEAAQAVSDGDLTVQIHIPKTGHEFDQLIDGFNRMVQQLNFQQEEIRYSQRKAAWSDIARKIAHEIKNPLTPIQLSAERIRRRYGRRIDYDPETFNNCIDTILRQVEQIRALVTEFSNFARMPDPVFAAENLSDICQIVIDAYQGAHPDLEFLLSLPRQPVTFSCDRRQIEQILANLLQNAVNALIEQPAGTRRLVIALTLAAQEETVDLTVEDNGPGFPEENREQLLEPYYTTREKGTGLGLAIVAKIAADHGGTVTFGDSERLGGARITISFHARGHEDFPALPQPKSQSAEI